MNNIIDSLIAAGGICATIAAILAWAYVILFVWPN